MNWENLQREVYCFHCKVYTDTDQPVPVCKTCKSKLYTVCKSIITGERLTGATVIAAEFPIFVTGLQEVKS